MILLPTRTTRSDAPSLRKSVSDGLDSHRTKGEHFNRRVKPFGGILGTETEMAAQLIWSAIGLHI